MENPKDTTGNFEQCDGPRGRPPDTTVLVGMTAALERPGSPVAVEDQRESKKSKSDILGFIALTCMRLLRLWNLMILRMLLRLMFKILRLVKQVFNRVLFILKEFCM
ncbi:hypothetical protein V6N13_037414 [Hibiscus sabdariffa]